MYNTLLMHLSGIMLPNSNTSRTLTLLLVRHSIAGFNVQLDTLQVILGTIFPANHLHGAKNWIKSNQTVTKLQHKKPINNKHATRRDAQLA